MPDEIYLTAEGAEELRQELIMLTTVRRPELARKLREAVEDGDLKENANYHDAREQQALVEGRIQYLENILRSAQIISRDATSDTVQIGSEVTIREEGSDEDETYVIVGAAEANPREGRISHESPIGSVLLGRKKGDIVQAVTPAGSITFRIRHVR